MTNGGYWGSMRVSETARRGVVFLGRQREDGTVHYGGTGFLVHYVEEGVNVCYLVTARHVAERLTTRFIVRANLRDGGSEEIAYQDPYWAFPEDPTVDIALALCVLPGDHFENTYFRLNDGLVPESEVTCGDPISIIGLFRLHKGSSRNIPVVHSGHIAALPDPKERIPAKDGSGRVVGVVAYLIEAQTLEGLSGSPVWITRFAKLPGVKTQFSNAPQVMAGMSLLGVYQASWEGVPDEVLAAERNFSAAVRVPVGVGLVVPGREIVKVIENHHGLGERKAAYIKKSLELGVSLHEPKAKAAPEGA
jgi:hypothetical protein